MLFRCCRPLQGYKLEPDAEGEQLYHVLSEPSEIGAGADDDNGEPKSKKRRKADEEPKLSASTIFGAHTDIFPTEALVPVFRYRVIVGKVLKIAKPYIMTNKVVKLQGGMPQQVHTDRNI